MAPWAPGWIRLCLSRNFQGGAIAHGFDVPRVKNCLLEFSVKAHPQ